MSEAERVLRQALAIGALGVLAAAVVHLPLIKRFLRGEFHESFFQASEYPGVRLITLEEAEELWRTAQATFVDARRTGPYAEGHVPGARSSPASESGKPLAADLLSAPRERALVVYCEGGDCQSSLLLAKRLHAEGFKDVRVMTGGWQDWKKAGLPEVRGDGQE